MKKIFKKVIRPFLQKKGFDIVRYQKESFAYPRDLSTRNISICEAVKSYTLTSPERVNALIEAVEYVVKNKINGAMVECGVWKGGSSMAIALALKELGVQDRELYLYDTFSGMSAPTGNDVSFTGIDAQENFSKTKISEEASDWCRSPLDEVQENIFKTGYPKDRIHFILGKVEETIPKSVPKKIALLRLDTDWYESTRHELIYLFPLLQTNGILIIDDYGYWKGARKAVDEYIFENNVQIFLNRIDWDGRIAVKT